MRTLSLTVTPRQEGETVNTLLRREFLMSSSLVSRIKLRETGICLNGQRVFTNARVKAGDILTAEIGDPPSDCGIEPFEYPLDILWEDEDILIINKPADMAVHGSPFREDKRAVANAAAFHLGQSFSFHPVNRLDRGTSGVMTIAKSSYIHHRLQTILHTGLYRREYLAVALGRVLPEKGSITSPIARAPDSVIKRVVSDNGAEAVTDYETVFSNGSFTLLRVTPQTGRTHQIRLHFSALGHPLAGDWLYGEENAELISRPALHSYKLEFTHPVTGERLCVTAPLQEDMRRLLTSV